MARRMRPLMFLLAAFAALLAAPVAMAGQAGAEAPTAAPSPPPVVESFQPSGTVKRINQVSVRFSAAMVALGDPRLADPFNAACPVSGHGSWADPRNWVYDFSEELPGGVHCVFTLKRGLKTLAGETVGGRSQFEFSTGGPAITASYPRAGLHRIDETQVFLLKTDAPVDAASVRAHVHCLVDGLAEEIPVEVLEGAARTEILAQRDDLGYGYYSLLWGEGAGMADRLTAAQRTRAEAQITALRCLRRLPPATGVTLRWGSGVKSLSGMATTADRKLRYAVRPAFTAHIACRRSNPRAGCLPFEPITLSFSAPVPATEALKARIRLASGSDLAPVEAGQPGGATLEALHFAPPFVDGVPVVVSLPPSLVDDAQRPLENAARFPLEVRIDTAPPLAKFSGTFGILEASEGGVLPLTVRNVEPELAARQIALPAKVLRLGDDPAAVARWMGRVEAAGEPRGEMVTRKNGTGAGKGTSTEWREDTGSQSVFGAKDAPSAFSIPRPAGAKPMEVIGIPLKEPGFYVVEVESRLLGRALLGRDQTRYVATAALVTDLSVHFQWGRDASTVWVTRLHDGAPVADAEVAVVRYCGGEGLWTGRTGKDGIAVITQSLGEPRGSDRCYPNIRTDDSPLLVTARAGTDFSFTQSGWGRGIEPEQFGVMVGGDYTRVIRHSVLDRALFRAGETVSMKHFLRRHVMSGFAVPAEFAGRKTIVIEHAGSGQHYEHEAVFGADGIGESQWTIPAEAKLGDYVVSIKDGKQQWQSGSFKVEQFRLPSMRGTVTGPAQPLVRPETATLDLHVAYLSGGGASSLPVKLRTLVEPLPVGYPAYADYQFGGHPVKEGVTKSEHNATDLEEDEDGGGDEEPTESVKTQVMPLMLDAAGAARVTVPKLPPLDGPARLTAELEYTDANGEVLTATGHVQLLPSAVSVGIRREGWVASSDQLRFRVAVVDVSGKPLAGKPVAVTLYQRNHYSYRKRLIGGFYAYESLQEVRRLPVGCKGTTDGQGLLLCELAPKVSGEVLLRAESKDGAGHPSGATSSVWLANGDSWWFGGTAGDRMDLLPEKQSYEAGDKARFQVRMPFRQATALVSVEREGVIKSFVTHLDGRRPIVEVPVEPGYAPNVFVSVLAVRGRVAHTEHAPVGEEITALVDLNKPAYRLGLAEIKVGWRPHRLDVAVTADRKTYKVRDSAKVKIHVARADGGALPAGTEVAVAAVDEALLDRAPNDSVDLLAAMMGERGLEVRTATAQSQVVGKRHYGRKAVPAGGGGGRDGSRGRELFDSLLYWKGRISVDARGDAEVAIPLNDSLSSFRIVAVASGAAAYFGSGATAVQTTQDLILLSGLPPLVREADHYQATFTVRNTTSRAMNVEVTAQRPQSPGQPLPAQTLALAAGQSRDVSFATDAPLAREVRWEVAARDVGGTAKDQLHVTQAVIPAIPVQTYQATVSQWQDGYHLPVAMPAGALPGAAGWRSRCARISPTVLPAWRNTSSAIRTVALSSRRRLRSAVMTRQPGAG